LCLCARKPFSGRERGIREKVNWPENLPARPYPPDQDEDWTEIRAAMAGHIMGARDERSDSSDTQRDRG
jgi:hypothetical protein